METNVMIKVEGLTKRFGGPENGVLALDNIDLCIERGEIFGVIGLSGAGKSTLVRCMNLIEKPTSGHVIVDGKKLEDLSEADLRIARRSISMIFQQFNLIMQKSVIDNVCFPLRLAGVKKKDAIEKARALLKTVGLEDKEKSYPAQLSGGQKQRVAIARALASDPKVLLCDEATSALDPTTTRSILALLKEINESMGITIVVITHEMKVVEEICSRVAIIDDGKIAESGNVADIFTKPKTAAARRLLLPSEEKSIAPIEGKQLRIVFDGNSAFEPVIAGMILECKEAVNILFADTKTIDGKMFGHMVVQLPQNETAALRFKAYLEKRNVKYEEVEYYV